MAWTLSPTLGLKGHRPTLSPALGLKGYRPTRWCRLSPTLGLKGSADGVPATARTCSTSWPGSMSSRVLHANTSESPTRAKAEIGKGMVRRLQEAFAAHQRHVAGLYPAERHGRMVLIVDDAPWHRGKPIDEALADCPHLEFKRLPSDSPQLNVIERSWELLRRRATHNRLFESLADLKRSLRASLCYFQR
ncbi:MAG: transposase [Singulisphaera sp.]